MEVQYIILCTDLPTRHVIIYYTIYVNLLPVYLTYLEDAQALRGIHIREWDTSRVTNMLNYSTGGERAFLMRTFLNECQWSY